MSINSSFRLLDLPIELRKRIYQEVFDGSSIVIKRRLQSKPAHTIDDLLQQVDLRNYYSALTFTSQQIRSESRDLLDRATTLIFRDAVLRNLCFHLEKCPPHLLLRIKKIRFITFNHTIYDIDPNLRSIISCLPGLRDVECCIDLIAGRWSPYEALEIIDDFNQREEHGPGWELDLDEDRDSILEGVTSIDAFTVHAAAWTRSVLPFEDQVLRMKTMVMAPFFALDELNEQVIDEREGAYPPPSHPRVSMSGEEKYGLLTWNGRELRSREMVEDEAFYPDYHQIMVAMG